MLAETLNILPDEAMAPMSNIFVLLWAYLRVREAMINVEVGVDVEMEHPLVPGEEQMNRGGPAPPLHIRARQKKI